MSNTKLAKILDNDFFGRNLIGYDNIFNDFINHYPTSNYPPHNHVIIDDNTSRLELAVAGFAPEEISVVVENGVLSVEGEKADITESETYAYRGISSRKFTQAWRLAEYWEVDEASFNNGILTIILAREVPEAHKPKKIEIKTS